ncbi:transglutaminase family protein [Cereibacter changlensis]|uniref:Transglutaminase family protein n=1 Tax=Cereibacter changlensis TaxID=402884 RepID=A0A4V5NLN1_9RHOB|nr:transglutaminase family protein [Cereibacter changlensis]TKA96317.1 transglutaminase family protein [Cereibacter changlensis]
MRIRIGFDITIERLGETPVVLALAPRPEEDWRLEAPMPIELTPASRARPFTDAFGNRRLRVPAASGPLRMRWDAVAQDDGLPDGFDPEARCLPIDDLPAETLQYLSPSRYCESDLLTPDAWAMFGALEPGWQRVQAICDFVHNHIQFGYGHASPNKTALDVWRDGRGVCRDFAHLTIALCRALNIPARYCSGYLGDIGVPYAGEGDFCAWVEVHVGGVWRTIDARYNMPRIGRIVMVRGRDAVDVPMITAFGAIRMEAFKVWCDEVTAEEEHAPQQLAYAS